MTLDVRVVHGHTGFKNGEPCFERHGEIDLHLNTWAGLTHVYRSKVGDNRGDGWRWIRVECNTPGCKFEALVSVTSLERAMQEALR